MDKELVKYITTYYLHLFSDTEKLALKHIHSTVKLSDYEKDDRIKMTEVYKKVKWLTDQQSVLELIKDGEDAFLVSVAKRIMEEYPDKIFLNYCPKCNRLARTPSAKQCRFCNHDWH